MSHSNVVDISNAPKGVPYDYVELWLKEHHKPDGTFVEVEQLNKAAGDISFQWGIGPFVAKGTINIIDLSIYVEIGVTVPFIGYVKITSVKGNLKEGVTISFDVAVASGSVTFFLRNGNELWIRYKFSALGASYSGESKILTF